MPHTIIDGTATPVHRLGLHGHRIGSALGRASAAEFAGTFVLVVAIATTAVAATLHTPGSTVLGGATVPVAATAALTAMIVVLGGVSGGHFNPAVTVALAVIGRFPWSHVALYAAAQLAGGVAAGLAVWGFAGPPGRSAAALGATTPAPGVNGLRVLLIEAVVTFLLVLVIVAVAADPSTPRSRAALTIGVTLGLAILLSGPLTGAGVNPARALGPMLVAGHLTDWWAYLLGPLAGGAAATLLYDRLLPATRHP
ncbi:glycerol uptake facilitator protein [Actinoplanes sp. OR16]|uniref:MIP/aquaporin family protein n=1 Tax=Actinoplanes sp. OR16 TaxID=946334 RepID=UPI000F71DF07|nr:aquaporin [Actinoplanes sp. OR16]BBH70168.1 glycerol uptake facilitator protein [Actinoplanes sp. OR16]